VVIGRITDSGCIEDMTLVQGFRPEPGKTQTAIAGSGLTFKITRPDRVADPSGAYAQLIIKGDKPVEGKWVALAVKVCAPNKKLGTRYFTVSPYCPELCSGEMASVGLNYLFDVDSTARKAIEIYGSKEVREKNIQSAAQVNVIIALVEQVGPENLGDMDAFVRAISRFLYNVATHRNQAKFLTVSKANARGPYQILTRTEHELLSRYGNDPWNVFDKWSKANNYPPRAWLNPNNRLGDLTYFLHTCALPPHGCSLLA